MSTIPPTIYWKNERLQRLAYCNLYNDLKYLKNHCQEKKQHPPQPAPPPPPYIIPNIAQVLFAGNNALAPTSLAQMSRQNENENEYKSFFSSSTPTASNYIYNTLGYGYTPINPATTTVPSDVSAASNKFVALDDYGDIQIHDGMYWNSSSLKNLPFGYNSTTLQNNIIRFTWNTPTPTSQPSICTLLLNNNFNIVHDTMGDMTNIVLRKIYFYFNFYNCQNTPITTPITYTFPSLTQNNYINVDYSEVVTYQNGNINVGRTSITVTLSSTSTGGTAIITIIPTNIPNVPVQTVGSNGNISMNCRFGMTIPCSCELSYIS